MIDDSTLIAYLAQFAAQHGGSVRKHARTLATGSVRSVSVQSVVPVSAAREKLYISACVERASGAQVAPFNADKLETALNAYDYAACDVRNYLTTPAGMLSREIYRRIVELKKEGQSA